MNIAVILIAFIAIGSLALAAHLHSQLRSAEVRHRGEVRRLKKAYLLSRSTLGRKSTELARAKNEIEWLTNSSRRARP